MRIPETTLRPHFLEALEPRIAPAGLADIDFRAAPSGSSILLKSGEGIATADTGGSYLLYVEQGQALVFTTDLNANNSVDFNEITGISAGPGLKLTSFVDINGDVVTNLRADGRLTDSDGNAANGNDGRVVLNNRIDSITLRSITAEELPVRPGETVENRLIKSTYSINGNIYAGGGLGTSGNLGLRIDTSGFTAQEARWGILTLAGEGGQFPIPSVGYVITGSAVSGQQFSFGTSPDFGNAPTQSLRGQLAPFVAAAGQIGGDVIGIRAGVNGVIQEPVIDPVTGEPVVDPATGDPLVEELEGVLPTPFHIGGIITGNGGSGARGGDIVDVAIQADIGGLRLETGNGGNGEVGGNGGNIIGLEINESVNSKVVIKTGNGGDGLIGAAGTAGRVQFDGEVDMMGRITIGLGRGGDASGNAGAGTSIANSDFEDVKPGTFLPAQFITTWRQPGDIGDAEPVFVVPDDPASGIRGYVTRSIDFDHDGFADAVMLTNVPDQLVVAMGSRDPASPGTFDPNRSLYLDSPSYAAASTRTSAVVVLDAGGAVDGRQFINGAPNPYFGQSLPDLATGQSSGDGYLGVTVQLNKGFDPLTGQWLGFELPRYSPLPLYENLRDTTQAVVNLAAGDFDRDGVMDLGVITVGRTANLSPPFFGALTVMSGLKGAGGAPDGYFAADFDKGTGNLIRKQPIFSFGNGNQETFTFVLHATAAEAGNEDSDLLGVLSRGGRDIGASVVGGLGSGEALNTFAFQPTSGVVTEALEQNVSGLRDENGNPIVGEGFRYTERRIDGNPAAWVGYGTNYRVIGSDFVFLDVDSNGVFDAVVVGQPTGDGAPGYLVSATLQGFYSAGPGVDYDIDQPRQLDPGILSGRVQTPGGLYFGIALSERTDPPVASVLGNDLQDRQVLRMTTGNFDISFDPALPTSVWEPTFALNGIDLFGNNDPVRSQIAVFAVTGFGQYPSAPGGLDEYRRFSTQSGYTIVAGNENATRTSFFGYYRPEVDAVLSGSAFLTAGLENELAPIDTFWGVVVPGANPRDLWFPLAASTLELAAGAGGWSVLAKGGPGGSIGGGVLTLQDEDTLRGSINSNGHVLQGLLSGAGGFGLLGGGAGGNISGVVATAQTNFVPPDVRVTTAPGGSSFLGAGGKGGSVSQFQFRTNLVGTTVIFSDDPPAITMSTGSGGFGLTGGDAGSIIGRGDGTQPDTNSDSTVIRNGSGGYGIQRGGSGGGSVDLLSVFGIFGGVDIATGNGASSAAGIGGAGGDLKVRPSALTNLLQRGLSLIAGEGGAGLTGGRGGNISDFINEPSVPGNPATLLALAGHGGDGVTGPGGAGGSITGFSATVEAVGGIGLVSAGDGGVGSASSGGAGGSLRSTIVSSEAGAAVGVAGVGGDGLRSGGAGGDLTNVSLNSGGLRDARVVAMAGAGGDAYGVSQRTVDREGTAPIALFSGVFTMGRSDGRGGNGGSVTEFLQPGATQASVDLMAGNGGATVNFGRISDLSTLTGRGGSITRANLDGDAGVMNSNVLILSYASDFASQLRNGSLTVINSDTEGVGNVGVLVGAGGLVRNDQPAAGAIPGSVQDFKARNVMSMVAGSVERVAAIASVSGLQLQNGGNQIGAIKNFYIDRNTGSEVAVSPADRVGSPTLYFDSPASPPRPLPVGFNPYSLVPSANGGGALIDGAVVTKKYSGPASNFVFTG